MSDAYVIVDIPKSLPIHGMALIDKHWQENRAQQGSGWYPNIQIADQLYFPQKVGIPSSLMCNRPCITRP